MDLKNIYTELIMEHNMSKHNKGPMEDADASVRGHNPNCGDDLTVNLKVQNHKIVNISYEGTGCAISEASASLMIDLLKGASTEEAEARIELFLKMITEGIDDEEAETQLEDASILANIKTMPARVKCAVLAWHALQEGIRKEKDSAN